MDVLDFESVFELFDDERKACMEDVRVIGESLKDTVRNMTIRATSDEPCDANSPAFLKHVTSLYSESLTKIRKGTKP